MSTTVSEKDQDQWSPNRVWDVTEKMQTVERVRAGDRALIDALMNGRRPYTAEEVERYQIHINVNWGEGKRILIPAINQLNNALIFKERFFTARSKGGKTEKKEDYSEIFTRLIHEPLKTGLCGQRQMFLLQSRNAAVALHGIGPLMWMTGFRWRARFIPLEDLLIPTDTLCDFSNCMFFAVNLYLTIGEFFDMACGGKVQKGWNQKMVDKIVDDLIKPRLAQSTNFMDVWDRPQQRVDWLKQNRCMWDYDAATTVKLRTFFYKHHETKKWHRCIILREGTPSIAAPTQTDFLFHNSKEPFAANISQIIHVQFGDQSVTSPLKYHDVRGLGVDLYGPVESNNRLRCEFQQHVLLNLKTLLRIKNPADRDRPKMLELSQYSVIPEGVEMIPPDQRYQIDANLAETALSQNKQLMGEAGSSYVKDVEGTTQPRTATESSVLSQQATESVSNMLQGAYAREEFYWEEEVRRFCDEKSEDEEVKEFQKECIAQGIPKELMVAKNWSVKIERALGGGDQYQANVEADSLLGQSQRFDPKSQRTILKKWVTTKTRDPKMAEMLVPTDPNAPNEGTFQAEDCFGALMQGIPCSIREGIERTTFIESLLGMMGSKIQQIQSFDNMGTPDQLVGLQTVGRYIAQNIQILAADPQLKQQVKMYSDELGKLNNEVKGFNQRQAQAAQSQSQDPEADAKVQAIQQQSQVKLQSAQQSSQQKMQQKEAQFEQKMQQKEIEFQTKMQQQMQAHLAEMQVQMEQARAQLVAEGIKTGSDIANAQDKAKADAEIKRKQAAAAPAKK